MKRTTTHKWIGALIATGAVVAPAPAVSADPVTGGKTVLKPDVDTFEGLADMSISVGAMGAARDGRNGVNFPITGGDVSEGPKGSIEHRGGLVFSQNTAAGGIAKFSAFTVRIGGGGKAKLFAKSDHSEVRFFDLDLSDATISGSAGTKLKIKGAEASLAKQGAGVLTEAFDFPFRKGIPVGTVTVKASLTS